MEFNSHPYKFGLIDIVRRIRKKWRTYNKRLFLKRIISSEQDLKVILGAGSTNYEGWISTDISQFNILKESDWSYYFNKYKPVRLLAEHVVEHFTENQTEKLIKLAFESLQEGGVFRIAVPDAFHFNKEYIGAVKPGGWDAGADDHKTFWNIETLTQIAKNAGFEVFPLEFFDANHNFHMFNYNDLNGYVYRSRKHKYIDMNVPDYTSLIIDLVKTENEK